jgi:hypothetical protein
MKYLYLSSLCIILGCVAKAQLSIVPQFGMESSKTKVSYNNSSDYSPLGSTFAPHASVRLDYKFKQGHGPYVGLATSRSGVNYTFSNPETGKTDYSATQGNTQFRLEGGYQYTTKPIYFNKSGSKNKSTNSSAKPNTTTKSSCRDYYMRSQCGSKSYKTAEVASTNNKGSWVSIQPSAGMAFVPSASSGEIASTTQGNMPAYEYNAGEWTTAFVAGAGFIFGKNDHEKLIVSVNYLKGIGNLQTQTLSTTLNSKTTTTTMSSEVSNWNVRIGIPFSLKKKPPEKKEVVVVQQQTVKQPSQVKQPALKQEEKPKEQKRCGSYYMYKCRKPA